AANAVVGGYEGYAWTTPAPPLTSARIAISQAAHDTLVALYPSHGPRLDALLADDLNAVSDGPSKGNGVTAGSCSAPAILALRSGDGSDISDAYVFSQAPGKWRVDPINPTQKPLGENWYAVKPFALNSASQFRCPEPPAMDSQEYTD